MDRDRSARRQERSSAIRALAHSSVFLVPYRSQNPLVVSFNRYSTTVAICKQAGISINLTACVVTKTLTFRSLCDRRVSECVPGRNSELPSSFCGGGAPSREAIRAAGDSAVEVRQSSEQK